MCSNAAVELYIIRLRCFCDPNDAKEIRKLLQLLKSKIDNNDENRDVYKCLRDELIERCPNLECVLAEVGKSHKKQPIMQMSVPELERVPEPEQVREPEQISVLELESVYPEAKRRCAR